jgi:2-C-methyl-D-erythritol 4-phosphate cytidylyltransferase
MDNTLIHDAARALVPPAVIDRVLGGLAAAPAVMACLPASDTIVRVDGTAGVEAVLDRDRLRMVQTPQGFRTETIRLAHALAREEGYRGAGDDGSLVLRYKLAPLTVVRGDVYNIKVTYPEDLVLAEAILNRCTK